MSSNNTRREFVKKAMVSSAAFANFGILQDVWASTNGMNNNDVLSVHIFSKHLQFLDYKTTGAKAVEMGFSGVDLTVRPKGHVLPENVKTDLPKAITDIKSAGSTCDMITTRIDSITNPLDVNIIETASKLGVKYYRSNWFKYLEEKTMEESLDYYKKEVANLSQLNKKHNIIGCYQNHAGTNIGASFWEIKSILEDADTNYFGTHYDIRHAIAEGGHSWKNGLELLKPYIKGVVLKDFKWGKVNGKWKPINVPIGEGMVDFDTYFKLLKSYNLKPPVSLHLEYDLGGAEKGFSEISVDKKVVFNAMRKDLKMLQKFWREA